MTNFERLDWKQLSVFCDTLNTSSSFRRDVIRRRFNSKSLHFDETLDFLIKLGLVMDNGETILPSGDFQEVLTRASEDIKFFFVRQLFKKGNPFAMPLAKFLNNFELHESVYKYTPNIDQRLKYSGIRNFLINFGIISPITPDGSYVVSDRLSVYFLDRKGILSYTEFVGRLRASEELGRKAELVVLEEERRYFKDYPYLLDKIQHVSLQDVGAGYDIKSFEEISTEKGKWQPKYIEVKAVSKDDLRFYWSRNEINKARQFGRNYYLYLLPVKSEAILDISALQKIRDPYREIFQDKNEWLRETEITSFYKK